MGDLPTRADWENVQLKKTIERLQRDHNELITTLENMLPEPSKLPGESSWAVGRLQGYIHELKRAGEDKPKVLVDVERIASRAYNSDVTPGDALCGYQVYDIDAYQSMAVSTMAKEPDDFRTRLAICGLGLAGESGEVADHIKKYVGHGHDLDVAKVNKECGDLLWYVAVIAHVLGLKLSEITAANIEKLRKRYPNGFSSEASKNRKPGDE